MTKIVELYHVPSKDTFLFLVEDSGTLRAYTVGQDWAIVGGPDGNIDALLEAVRKDKDHYLITEFEMKGQWKNHE